ncbi:reverse transcriptase domain-containing protein [Myxococcus sp. AS-1-15]|uniref:reverse transcriptase domain-containing protein n=1 Tax=Myxococcus sp. AS-1-15 TaxID=2874600 RepID=UPI001CBA943A|nr:reverse transcriptase domain-containing protein [Myxococcus sp. AS-1-15]MBZ4402419.1 hypothetical protein [Myxococcus sp. AS-1-15]
MAKNIREAIAAEAQKLVTRHQRYAWNLHEDVERREARSGLPCPKEVKTPSYWSCDPGFNPYHVRKNALGIAYAIQKSLKSKRYRPRPAVLYPVPKLDGTYRPVSIFQVADQAISRLVFSHLLEKNKGRFSARSFAYRNDLSVHDAILHLASSLAGRRRVFMAEYDFTKYFDMLSHEHINRVLRDKRFFITDEERQIAMAFVESSIYPASSYSREHSEKRTIGIPQGASTSLFLANIAAYPLDRRLEQLRVDFARYADDTLIWSDDYGELCRAVDTLAEVALEMGVDFNLKKSPGVRLLVEREAKAELSRASEIEFVGYRVDAQKIGIRDLSVDAIKEHISYLIYSNLLEQPRAGQFLPSRVLNTVDTDYNILILQLQRYLYGNLTEEKLSKYLAGDAPQIHYQGLMSFYPIVNDLKQLRELDGWLLHTVFTTLRLRSKLYASAGTTPTAFPHGNPKEQLVKPPKGLPRLPSFFRISKLLNRASVKYGATSVADSGPSS